MMEPKAFSVLEVKCPRDPAFYMPTEPFLTRISVQCVALRGDKHELFQLCKNVIDTLIFSTRQEHPNCFGKIYSELIPVGSFFDRLKVMEATEFDFNVVLDVPFLKFKMVEEPEGFIKLVADERRTRNHLETYPPELQRAVEKWIGSNGCIESQKVKSYMESVSSHWEDEDLSSFGVETVKVIKNGPATSIVFRTPLGKEISLDIVPVIRMTEAAPHVRSGDICKNNPWYLVPKSRQGNNISWRPSFPINERRVLQGRARSITRLVKRVRDVLRFHQISSYAIKTLMMWKVRDDKLDWERNAVSYLFFHMLLVLQQCLEKHYIPHFWCQGSNILENVNRETTRNYGNRLNGILERIGRILIEGNVAEVNKVLKAIFEF